MIFATPLDPIRLRSLTDPECRAHFVLEHTAIYVDETTPLYSGASTTATLKSLSLVSRDMASCVLPRVSKYPKIIDIQYLFFYPIVQRLLLDKRPLAKYIRAFHFYINPHSSVVQKAGDFEAIMEAIYLILSTTHNLQHLLFDGEAPSIKLEDGSEVEDTFAYPKLLSAIARFPSLKTLRLPRGVKSLPKISPIHIAKSFTSFPRLASLTVAGIYPDDEFLSMALTLSAETLEDLTLCFSSDVAGLEITANAESSHSSLPLSKLICPKLQRLNISSPLDIVLDPSLPFVRFISHQTTVTELFVPFAYPNLVAGLPHLRLLSITDSVSVAKVALVLNSLPQPQLLKDLLLVLDREQLHIDWLEGLGPSLKRLGELRHLDVVIAAEEGDYVDCEPLDPDHIGFIRADAMRGYYRSLIEAETIRAPDASRGIASLPRSLTTFTIQSPHFPFISGIPPPPMIQSYPNSMILEQAFLEAELEERRRDGPFEGGTEMLAQIIKSECVNEDYQKFLYWWRMVSPDVSKGLFNTLMKGPSLAETELFSNPINPRDVSEAEGDLDFLKNLPPTLVLSWVPHTYVDSIHPYTIDMKIQKIDAQRKPVLAPNPHELYSPFHRIHEHTYCMSYDETKGSVYVVQSGFAEGTGRPRYIPPPIKGDHDGFDQELMASSWDSDEMVICDTERVVGKGFRYVPKWYSLTKTPVPSTPLCTIPDCVDATSSDHPISPALDCNCSKSEFQSIIAKAKTQGQGRANLQNPDFVAWLRDDAKLDEESEKDKDYGHWNKFFAYPLGTKRFWWAGRQDGTLLGSMEDEVVPLAK